MWECHQPEGIELGYRGNYAMVRRWIIQTYFGTAFGHTAMFMENQNFDCRHFQK